MDGEPTSRILVRVASRAAQRGDRKTLNAAAQAYFTDKRSERRDAAPKENCCHE